MGGVWVSPWGGGVWGLGNIRMKQQYQWCQLLCYIVTMGTYCSVFEMGRTTGDGQTDGATLPWIVVGILTDEL